MSAAVKRILFVQGSGYLPRAITGANVSLDALCKRLRARGVEPLVLCTADPPGATADPGPGPDYGVARIADPIAAFAETARSFAPDAIVIRAPDPAERLANSPDVRGRRVHIYCESPYFSRAFPSPRHAPDLRYGANSPFLARMGEAMLATPVAMIPPVIEPEYYRCNPAGDAILFVNPIAMKGVHIAAAIAAALPQRRFLFVRSWPETATFPHYQPRLANIEWVPSAHDMRPLFTRTKLLLMPSVWEESSGRTLGEAQVSGIPTIASDRGGMRDAIGPGGGVVPLGAPIAQWCAAIERVFDDGAHYAQLSEGARRHAARPDYQPEAVIERFLEFVES
jgi:glycosyltransferase involved in cell wall biosynthesis